MGYQPFFFLFLFLFCLCLESLRQFLRPHCSCCYILLKAPDDQVVSTDGTTGPFLRYHPEHNSWIWWRVWVAKFFVVLLLSGCSSCWKTFCSVHGSFLAKYWLIQIPYWCIYSFRPFFQTTLDAMSVQTYSVLFVLGYVFLVSCTLVHGVFLSPAWLSEITSFFRGSGELLHKNSKATGQANRSMAVYFGLDFSFLADLNDWSIFPWLSHWLIFAATIVNLQKCLLCR